MMLVCGLFRPFDIHANLDAASLSVLDGAVVLDMAAPGDATVRMVACRLQVIDRILYKLDELVRPFVHKILVVIEPLLIDEDYYARVEGASLQSPGRPHSATHVWAETRNQVPMDLRFVNS